MAHVEPRWGPWQVLGFDIQHLPPSLDVAMATLMEFAALQLDGAGGHGRAAAGPGDAPPVGVAAPALHLGSVGRTALDASGKRRARLLVIATKGSGTRALDMAVSSEGLCREGVLVLEEASMRGSALAHAAPLDANVTTLWGTGEDGGLLVLSLGGDVSAWRGHAVAAVLLANVTADRVVVLDELAMRDCAIEDDLDGDGSECSLVRQLPSDAELSRQRAEGDGAGSAAGGDIVARCPLLESGVVVSGVAAAVLTACHLRAMVAVVYVGLSREAPGGVARMHAHEDPSLPLAALLRAELSRAGFGGAAKSVQAAAAAAALLPHAGVASLYL